MTQTSAITKLELDNADLKQQIREINRKLDQLIEGPALRSTLTRIGTLEEICAKNLKSLNDMILQVKGVVTQVRTLRGRRSDWDGEEVKADSFKEVCTLDYKHYSGTVPDHPTSNISTKYL